MGTTPVAVLNIPHSSRVIPEEVRPSLVLSESDLQDEIVRLTDSYTDELFDPDSSLAVKVIAPVNRLVVDVERFPDDADEPMSQFGKGAVYLTTSKGWPLRNTLTEDEKQSLIEKYHEPFNRKLTEAVSEVLSAHGKCLIFDCHSFPSTPFEYELDREPDRPDICLGTDRYHTPAWLSDLAFALFQKEGYSAKINRPYVGSSVPSMYYRRNFQVCSIMIEVNRCLYMDEVSGERNARFNETRSNLQSVLKRIIEEFKG